MENKINGASERIESAVADLEPDELRKLYKKIGGIEFTARALGLACRFRGVEVVRALAECGASFDIPKGEAAEERYKVYSGVKFANYRSDFSLYLLDIYKKIPGACCCYGLKFSKYLPSTVGKKRGVISDAERGEVLRYLCSNAEKLSFEPSELLYFSIFARDEFIYGELKALGVTLSAERVATIVEGKGMSNMAWFEYYSLLSKLKDEDFLPVLERLRLEIGGKFYCTNKIYEIMKARFELPEVGELFCESFDTEKLNKTALIRGMIEANAANMLPFAEKAGWLGNNKRRDEMISYAREKQRVECVAWLLDFKNRTADLAAEKERAEKRMMRELNAAPDSVLALKNIWTFKKIDMEDPQFLGIDGLDGGLLITNYKGSMVDVVIPEKIGKSVVRAIGERAFEGGALAALPAKATAEQMQFRRDNLRSVTIPETVKYIGVSAFMMLGMLKTVDLPFGLRGLGGFAFSDCSELEEIDIPGSVRFIDAYAFSNCVKLKRAVVREGVKTIGSAAFSSCTSLETVELPASLESFDIEKGMGGRRLELFLNCDLDKLIVKCPKGSRAEEYCKKQGIKTVNREN